MRALLFGFSLVLASCAGVDNDGGTDGLDEEFASEADVMLDDGDGGGDDGDGLGEERAMEDLEDLESLESMESLEESMMEEEAENVEGADDGDGDGGETGSDGSAEGAAGDSAFAEYVVKEGDTLMWVAFRIYGDYARWRSFLEWNPGLKAGHRLSAGRVLRHERPAVPFEWSPEGDPHLIRSGETLGSISSDKYGTPARWRDLYENNRPMIKDPDLIFAGFTLYYIPLRDMASQ